MKEYTFEMMYEDLRNGYQIYYTYVRNRYLLFTAGIPALS